MARSISLWLLKGAISQGIEITRFQEFVDVFDTRVAEIAIKFHIDIQSIGRKREERE